MSSGLFFFQKLKNFLINDNKVCVVPSLFGSCEALTWKNRNVIINKIKKSSVNYCSLNRISQISWNLKSLQGKCF